MPRHQSPYARRNQRRVSPLLIALLGVLGFMVVVMGLFLLADRFGEQSLGRSSTPVAGEAGADGTPEAALVATTPREVAEAYARLWSAGDYAGMYELISFDSKRVVNEEDFVARYEAIAQEAGLVSLQATVGEAADDAEQLPIRVERESGKVGTFTEDNTIALVPEGDAWRVDWTPSLIFADLADGFIRWKADVPQRGRILDRKGRPLAHLGTIKQLGIVPGQIEDEAGMLQQLSELLSMSAESIKQRYEGGQPDWFMPLRSFPDQMDPQLEQQLTSIPGVVMQQWPSRVYPSGSAAAHVVGYLTEVTAEELPELSKQGYGPGDVIGRAGIERWGEEYLAGKRGGRLVIVGADGAERKTIAEVTSEPAADIVLTIDIEVQMAVDEILQDVTGSAVVIDPDTGAILAMVSRPTFDPNQFLLGHTAETWEAVSDPERRPLENRTTQFSYPNGSTFKVVPMAAAMEELDMTGQTMLECPAEFSIPGHENVWRDWSPTGQGTVTLHDALVQSCNTIFYEIGVELDTRNPQILPRYAREFGFGAPTGLPELAEQPGVVPDPDWKVQQIGDYWARGDAVNLSIGQGYFLATPLQVANAYAAIANGGTLWQPYLVQEVRTLADEAIYTAEQKEIGKLPVSPETLNEIRSAMRDVVSKPNGTATNAFAGLEQPAAGKTGTAETGLPAGPHAWFTAFSPVDTPDMALAVMVEHGGEGSQVAAPLAREIIEQYYLLAP